MELEPVKVTIEPGPVKVTIEPEPVKVTIKPESVKVTIEPEKDNKPDLNNDGNKQSSRLSSSSLDIAIDEKDFLSPHPWSMISASPPPDFGPHLLPELSTNNYDPNRIPTSIFSTKPDGWSVASNESLFSIQMGNNSFSHDNAILYEKSGELGRLDDWNPIGSQGSVHGNVPEPKKGHNNNNELSGGLTTVNEESSLTSGEISRVDSFDSPRDINRAKETMGPEDFKKGPNSETSLKSSSMPRTSDESGNSGSSFAFPVLVNDRVIKSGSSRKNTDTPDKPQLEAQVSNTTTKKAPEQGKRWFSRFVCWPRCC
ncbi:hypothetical protein CASFOL_026668 [Castilleja foliolosa]|uniref:Uncharacterized protein n=1 Tax=Castilleja foliolosa TaxID=1961234 RepID=A0ABD3CJE4_9LAMI